MVKCYSFRDSPPIGGQAAVKCFTFMLYTTVIARKSTSAKQGMLKKAKPFTARLDEEWILIYKESLNSRTEAIKREKQLKSFQGRKFIKQYIP